MMIRRGLVVAGLIVLLAALVGVAFAHGGEEGEEPADALTLLRQAMGALTVSPPNTGLAADKIHDALEAAEDPDRATGVDPALVGAADEALDGGDALGALTILRRALASASAGASAAGGESPPVASPAPSQRFGEASAEAAVASKAGLQAIPAVTAAIAADTTMWEPFEPKFTGTAVEYFLVVGGVALLVVGGLIVARR